MNDDGVIDWDRPLIVGMGASAGGLIAYETFLAWMPPDSGMALVLVQHLDPNHHSALAELLAAYTVMPVSVARDGMIPAANTVSIIPPGSILLMQNGQLRLAKAHTAKVRRSVVDMFLISLARDQGANAVGIILSGFGSDGTIGMAEIQACGGLTLCEADDDNHAKLGMPQSAADAGFVDQVLRVEDMPAALIAFKTQRAAAAASGRQS